MKRRSFLKYSSATLATPLLLATCQSRISTHSTSGEPTLSLEFISVPRTTSQTPAGLVVCLHGWGANAQDLASFSGELDLDNYQFFFPDAPFPHPNAPGGKMWYDLERQDFQQLADSRQRLGNFLNSLSEKTSVPLSRTFLSGFSQGGAMTLDVGLTLPLAGLISLSGYLHAEPQASTDGYPPILMMHGQQDQVVPLSAAQRAQMVLSELGATVDYHEFNIGHWIVPEQLTLMRRFIQLHS